MYAILAGSQRIIIMLLHVVHEGSRRTTVTRGIIETLSFFVPRITLLSFSRFSRPRFSFPLPFSSVSSLLLVIDGRMELLDQELMNPNEGTRCLHRELAAIATNRSEVSG